MALIEPSRVCNGYNDARSPLHRQSNFAMTSIDTNDARVRAVSLCRADKVLLGGAAVVGSSALLTAMPIAVGASAALLAVLTDGIFRPSSSVLYPTISHGPRDRPQVALTFDDGPDPQVTPTILDALKERRRTSDVLRDRPSPGEASRDRHASAAATDTSSAITRGCTRTSRTSMATVNSDPTSSAARG